MLQLNVFAKLKLSIINYIVILVEQLPFLKNLTWGFGANVDVLFSRPASSLYF